MQNWSHQADDAPPPAAPGPSLDRPPPPNAPPPVSGTQWGAPPQNPPGRPPAWVPPPPSSHQRLAWQPAPPEPGPTVAMRVGILATAVLILAAVITVGLVVADRRGRESVEPPPSTPTVAPTPTPSMERTWTPSPRPTPTPSPTAVPSVTVAADPGARSWELPPMTWPALPAADPDSPLYAAQVTPLDALPPVTLKGCPEPATTPTEEEWKAAVSAQWSCLHAAWVPVYEQLGWSVTEPEVLFYPGSGSNSECGYLSAPAFYCSAGEGKVYFGQEHFEMATAWDLSINEMVNHEYGHHLQKLAGITATKLSLGGDSENERRAELQATCWSAMQTWHNRSFEFDEADLASWNQRLETMREDGVHGSRASLTSWGTRGLYAKTVGDCNTWVATAEDVS